MEHSGLTLVLISWVLFCEVAWGKNNFHVCDAGSLRVTETFEASRMAASVFPCLVSDVLLAYRLPTSMLVAAYRPFCVVIRFCFAMISAKKVTTRRQFETVSQCIVESEVTFTNLGIFEYYGVPADLRREFAIEQVVRDFFHRTIRCYDKIGFEQFHMGPDIGIAIVKWFVDKLF